MFISRPAFVRIILFFSFLGFPVLLFFVWKEFCLFYGVFGGILCKIDLFLVWSITWLGVFFSVLIFACPHCWEFFRRICCKIDGERAPLFVIITPLGIGYGFLFGFGGGLVYSIL